MTDEKKERQNDKLLDLYSAEVKFSIDGYDHKCTWIL